MKTRAWLVIVVTGFLLGAFAQSQHDRGLAALIELEDEFMQATAQHGSEGYLSYYDDDAVEVPNGQALIKGKAEIAKTMGFLDRPENHLTWSPVGGGIASSNDLGYTYGTFEFRAKGKEGKPVVEHGKYVTIWRKQADGSWKVVLDMGNSGQ